MDQISTDQMEKRRQYAQQAQARRQSRRAQRAEVLELKITVCWFAVELKDLSIPMLRA